MDKKAPLCARGYQLRVSLRGVSPPVWRRIRVAAETTIAELHHVIQAAMGWEDIHLHRFTIRGQFYSVPRDGALTFSAGSVDEPLAPFDFREHERFTYEYDFYAGWLHDIRVEQILNRAMAAGGPPVCTAGVGPCPPEDSGPPERFMELLDQRSVYDFVELLEDELRCDEHEGGSIRDILDDWLPWVDRRFDRAGANARLASMTAYSG